MKFSDIAERKNGPDQRIDMDWFNAPRAAGIEIENFLGRGFIPETSVAIANNQAVPANVTGLVLDKTKYKSAQVHAEVRRKTDSGGVVSVRTFAMAYRDDTAAWTLDPGQYFVDDDGLTLSIVGATGQVQYVSTNIAGANYSGTMKFKAISFAA